MAEVNPPFVIQASSHPGSVFRRAIKALRGAQGVVASSDLAVSQNGTPNMSVNVAAGSCVVDGTENATSQGSYTCLNDAVKNLAVAASDPTNPRKDLVVAKVQDAEYSGAVNSWSLAVVTGTPAPSPVDPATPANAILLARIDVAALATTVVNANITDLRAVGVMNTSLASDIKAAALAAVAGILPRAARGDHQHPLNGAPILFGTVNGDGTTNTVTFSAIPTGYSKIIVEWKARTTSATNGEDGISMQFNSDTTAKYSSERLSVNGTTVTAQDGGVAGTSLNVGYVSGGGTIANAYGQGTSEILGYADSLLKTIISRAFILKAFAALGQFIDQLFGSWNSTAAINRIDIICGAGFWTTSSKFWLYLV